MKPSTPFPELPFKSDAFVEAWSDWVSFRREIRKPVTPTVAKYQFRQMAGWTERVSVAAITQSIERQWVGLFYPKDDFLSPEQGSQGDGRFVV